MVRFDIISKGPQSYEGPPLSVDIRTIDSVSNGIPHSVYAHYSAHRIKISPTINNTNTFSRMYDLSGNGRDLTLSAGHTGEPYFFPHNPTYNGHSGVIVNYGRSRPGIRAHTPLQSPDFPVLDSNSKSTMFIVCDEEYTIEYPGSLVNGYGNSVQNIRRTPHATYTMGRVDGTGGILEHPLDSHGKRIVTSVYTPNISSLYINGGTPVTKKLHGGPTTRISVGHNLSNPVDKLVLFSFTRILFWDRELTKDEINNVGNYLSVLYNFPWTNTEIERTNTITMDINVGIYERTSNFSIDMNVFSDRIQPSMDIITTDIVSSSLFAHYDSDALIYYGGTRYGLYELSGNKRHMNMVSNKIGIDASRIRSDPIYNGHGSFEVNGDGGNYNAFTTEDFTPISQPMTLFFVTTRPESARSGTMLNGGSPNQITSGRYQDRHNIGTVINGVWNSASKTVDSTVTKRIIVMVVDGENSKIYINGGTPGTGNIPGGQLTSLSIGKVADIELGDIVGNRVKISFSKYMVYTRALSTHEINYMGEYLSNRYDFPWTDIQ